MTAPSTLSVPERVLVEAVETARHGLGDAVDGARRRVDAAIDERRVFDSIAATAVMVVLVGLIVIGLAAVGGVMWTAFR